MTKQLNDFEEFISIYNAVDSYMRKVLKADTYVDHPQLIKLMCEKDRSFNLMADELRTMSQLRNVLVHNPFMNEAHPLAIPNRAIVEHYQDLYRKIIHPVSALSIAIPASSIYVAKLSDPVLPVIKTMAKNIYTHVPIFDGSKMVGVFSENTILSYLAHEEEAIITRDATISDFADYVPFESHDSEQFIFVSRKTSLHDVIEHFNKALRQHVRVGAIFITEHGTKNEGLLGLITAWDLAYVELL